jgi:competence protein ComFC
MLIRRFIELLTPESCLGCGKSGVVFCTTCRVRSEFGRVSECYRCGRISKSGETCELCQLETKLSGVAVASYYTGPVKELVLRLKFHRLQAAAEVAADMVAGVVPDSWGVGLVTSVPISAERYRERGYNQSELVARWVARRLGLPYSRLLERQGSVHQLGVDRRTRLAQVKGVFYTRRPVPATRVLIVDDVVTTGATLAACAEVLSRAGARGVWGAAVARH